MLRYKVYTGGPGFTREILTSDRTPQNNEDLLYKRYLENASCRDKWHQSLNYIFLLFSLVISKRHEIFIR